jgi:GntR family transcriptional repressor for pyruvate dehydrogenase complex
MEQQQVEGQSKVYLEIVRKLQRMIEEDHLVSGDKIPSERELSDRLNVGRSSVREALRALELLGLIETRRGEGTFIHDFQEHKLVELLGSFFVLEGKTKKDLIEVKELLEKDCIRIMAEFNQKNPEPIKDLYTWARNNTFTDEAYFSKLARLTENRLMERIWKTVNSYCKASGYEFFIKDRKQYIFLAEALENGQKDKALEIYETKIRGFAESE